MRRRALRDYLARTVVVHTSTDTIRGVLVGEYRDVLVLAHAVYVEENRDRDQQLPGETLIPREHVSFVQVETTQGAAQ